MKAAVLWCATLGVALIVAGTLEAQDPPAPGMPSPPVLEGRTIEEWHGSALLYESRWREKKRESRKQARTIRALRYGMRSRVRLGGHGLEDAFLCIFRYERGGDRWQTNTGNGYFGGLQMDRDFMAGYGLEFLRAWGTANNWPPSVQIAVSMRAYLSGRGFHPWPNTARKCGLL